MGGFDLLDECGRGMLAAEFSASSPDLRRRPDRAERDADDGGRHVDAGYRDRRPRGWAILYRVPEGEVHNLDDARPYSVVSKAGPRADFTVWRKVGRRRLGIGIGTRPAERV
jgi:hypothetical protein